MSGVSWRKSSYSQQGGACIEVAANLPTHIPVRDSKDPHGPALAFTPTAFTAFLAAIKDDTLHTT
ncbi:DUF397 domain-containing protein [Kitasatospora sp. LaBMicrA B282]|uniref:DUF397 domain-containing protein n=1 Tax=Kitasatospora sp. LaBMicrA B282 TaxID=3420949 RepID=UPI003D0D7544